jgi:excisionase family DNA binding protein
MPETANLSAKRLTVDEVAEILGLNKFTIYKWARLGLIPCIRQGRGGRQLRFKLSDIEKWEEEQTTGKL